MCVLVERLRNWRGGLVKELRSPAGAYEHAVYEAVWGLQRLAERSVESIARRSESTSNGVWEQPRSLA
eukprot:2689750-Amphidinium_carterae.1